MGDGAGAGKLQSGEHGRASYGIMSRMAAVLGIDAAWTATEPSGVALASQTPAGWGCVAVAPSYSSFMRLARAEPVYWNEKPTASAPNPRELLSAANRLLHGRPVAVVAVDMPLAAMPICARRPADNAVSIAFGKSGCGTHTPNAERPGRISTDLVAGFAHEGYSLATSESRPSSRVLIEVYPHPALLRLLGEGFRIPYKIGRARSYWPCCGPAERRARIFTKWRRILEALGKHIRGIPDLRPEAARPCDLKRYEDAIDALICAWVGTEYLDGNIERYGDEKAAIWVPKSDGEINPQGPATRT